MDDDGSSSPPCEGGAPENRGFFASLKRKLGGSERSADPVRDAIEDLIEDEQAAAIDGHERLLLSNILHLRDVTAYDVMVPRGDISAVAVDTELNSVADVVAHSSHSRLPVYRETLDDVLGMVHIKDVLPVVARCEAGSLRALIRRVMFVSPAIRVLDLLKDMRVQRTHMALVVDEYGGVDGLVTIEDLVEQIVGEIEDEHDAGDEPAFQMAEGRAALVDARLALEDFEHRVGMVFSDEDKDGADTLGGLVFRLAGRVPLRGELVQHHSGLEFEVIDADPRRIRRLRVNNTPPLRQPTDV